MTHTRVVNVHSRSHESQHDALSVESMLAPHSISIYQIKGPIACRGSQWWKSTEGVVRRGSKTTSGTYLSVNRREEMVRWAWRMGS
jgi:hypothetical protein